MSKKVLITPRTFGVIDPKPVEVLEELGFDLVFNPYGRLLTEDEMIELIGDVDGVIVGLDPLNERVLKSAKKLTVISKYGVGLDNVSIDVATDLGIMVTNTPGTNSSSVADLTMGLILDVARNISFCDRKIRHGEWGKYQGFELGGKTLGLVGTGQIGKGVANRAKGFGMNVVCYDIAPDMEWAKSVGARYTSLRELLASADAVSLHLPLSGSTYHLISDAELALMKPTAILVNTARGGVVDEAALYQTLKEERLAGAGLDVFETEPPTESPLLELENVVVTSHIGSHTREAVLAMGLAATQNLVDGLSGKRPKFLVNTEAGEDSRSVG